MSRWSLFGLIAAGSIVTGSCAGAVVGRYTVSGGFHRGAGWQVPSLGVDDELAAMPPARASEGSGTAPQFVGYYPDQASDVPDPELADTIAGDFDTLYDEPAFADAAEVEAPPPARSADDDEATWRAGYWEAGERGAAGG